MPNFISEDDIEQGMVQRLQHLFGYEALNCYTTDPADLNDDSGRSDKREVILHDRLKAAVIALNPGIPEPAIDAALKQLCDKRAALSTIAANREVDMLIREGVKVEFRDQHGKTRHETVKVIDFSDPEKNEFLAVTQLWIQSTGAAAKAGFRRPDILLYVNGLPLVFTELKNSNVKLRSAYDDNLTRYKADIPQLFLTNALCVFSNGIETRLGSLTAQWEHFFHWLRPEDEKEKVKRDQIREEGTSAERFLAVLARAPRQFRLGQPGAPAIGAEDAQHPVVQRHGDHRTVPRGDGRGRLTATGLRDLHPSRPGGSSSTPSLPGTAPPFPVLRPVFIRRRLRLHEVDSVERRR